MLRDADVIDDVIGNDFLQQSSAAKMVGICHQPAGETDEVLRRTGRINPGNRDLHR